MTQRDKWKKRPCVMRFRKFKDQVRLYNVHLPESAMVTFHLPMPRSWPTKKRHAMDGQPHRQKPDIDNLAKALLDALYGQDSHVALMTVCKRWSMSPGIEITEVSILPISASASARS